MAAREGTTLQRVALAITTIGLLAPLSAAATTITVCVSGTIDTLQDLAGVSDGSIAPGTPFTASATYDDSATPLPSA